MYSIVVKILLLRQRFAVLLFQPIKDVAGVIPLPYWPIKPIKEIDKSSANSSLVDPVRICLDFSVQFLKAVQYCILLAVQNIEHPLLDKKRHF